MGRKIGVWTTEPKRVYGMQEESLSALAGDVDEEGFL